MRIFEFIINPEDMEMGMKAISLVDKPAIESEYIAFNKSEKKPMYFAVDAKKYIVGGLALIPDKLIFRVDEATGEEYLGYFSAETIEVIMSKFMNESTDGTTHDVNFQHNSEDKVPAHLVESFILRTEAMVEAMKAIGIEEAVLGAWYVAYKFNDAEAYQKAIEGEFTGYSVEIILQRELKFNKNNDKNNNIMSKMKNFIDKFKTLLAEIDTELEDVIVPDAGTLRIGDVGSPVLWITVDEAGVEATEPAMEGDYILEDGRMIVVDAMGNLLEIKDNAEPAPMPEEELEKPEEELEVPEIPLEETPEEPLEEVPVEEIVPDLPEVAAVADMTIGGLIDINTDGEYYIKVIVTEGAITEATVEAEQVLIKAGAMEELQAEVERLTEELAKPVTKSAFTEFTIPSPVNKSKKDFKNNLEYQLHKHGLDK